MADYCAQDVEVRVLSQLRDDPELLQYAKGILAKGVAAKKLFASVDESVFGLKEWLEGLCRMDAWLDERLLELPLEQKIDFICCVAEAASAGAGLEDLPSLTEEMLVTYGCDGAVEKS